MAIYKSILLILFVTLGCKSGTLAYKVTIDRPVCFASCRAYTFTAHKNNIALHVNLKDKSFPVPLSSEQQQTFNTLVQRIKFSALDPFYGRKNVYDIPEVSIQYNQTKTTVKGISYAPEKLQTLLTEISRIVQTIKIEN